MSLYPFRKTRNVYVIQKQYLFSQIVISSSQIGEDISFVVVTLTLLILVILNPLVWFLAETLDFVVKVDSTEQRYLL